MPIGFCPERYEMGVGPRCSTKLTCKWLYISILAGSNSESCNQVQAPRTSKLFEAHTFLANICWICQTQTRSEHCTPMHLNKWKQFNYQRISPLYPINKCSLKVVLIVNQLPPYYPKWGLFTRESDLCHARTTRAAQGSDSSTHRIIPPAAGGCG